MRSGGLRRAPRIDSGARRRPPDRIERSHALGIVRLLRTPDCAAGILGPRRGAAAARSHHEDFRPVGRAAHRAVHVRASAKHVGLYQKFGYWPRYLTAIMTRTPEARRAGMRRRCYRPSPKTARASHRGMRETHRQDRQGTRSLWRNPGRAGAAHWRRRADLYARRSRCFRGVPEWTGSEGGEKTCYVKFGAARGGAGAGDRFDNCWMLARCLRPRAERRSRLA